MSHQIFSKGQVIFQEGDEGHCAYLIESGRIELSIAEQSKVLSSLGAGDIFGEVAIIERSPRSATAIAIEDTTLTVIDSDDLTKRMFKSDPVVIHLMKTLIRRQVKQRGGGIDTGLATSFSEGALKELLTESQIRDGLAGGEFEPFFQPIVRLHDRKLGGYEALVRWRRGDGRLMPPGEFLPVAERNARIQTIDLHILNAACAALASCRLHSEQAAAGNLFVTVNLAPVHFDTMNVVRELERVLSTHAILPRQLKVEVLETALLANIDVAIDVIGEIRALGVRVCLDDFGSGYSNLGYLHRLPIDTLKIDRSFVIGMSTSPRARKLVKGILELAAALDLETVVEGIESEDIAVQLATLGCTYGQGFLFGRPMERTQMLATHGVPVR